MEGEFPLNNTSENGYERLAPVKSYPANSFGLYDMAGNVWEWTNDWYNIKYYKELASQNKTIINPLGADTAYNPNNTYIKKLLKVGHFCVAIPIVQVIEYLKEWLQIQILHKNI